MNHPVFSIITPTFKRLSLLKRNILSVRNQTFENYEHIIIDDANDPETDRLVNIFSDDRIVLLHHEFSKGAGASYNTGIKASRGQFIVFLDDDDEYMPCFLRKMYQKFSNAKHNVGFILPGVSKIKDAHSGEELLSSIVLPSQFSTREEELIAATSIGNGYGVCIKRTCFDSIGMYDESLAFGQDTEFLFRLARNFECETIPEILVKIHFHEMPQLTDNVNNIKRLEIRERILEKNLDLLIQFPKLYYIHYQVVADLCYKLKLKKKGRKTMFSIIKHSPFKVLNFTDIVSFELFSKNTMEAYSSSAIRKVIHSLKLN